MPAASPAIKLDRTRMAAPQVFEKLREMILALELAPGTVLSRAELAVQFGVSQTPVREALIKLGEEGLVDIFPQHATVVSRIGLAAARQAHFLRLAIELEVVSTLAGLPAAELEALLPRLKAQIDAQAKAMGRSEASAFVAADRAFHQLMIEAAGVPGLGDLIRQRSGQVDRLRRLHLPAKGKMQAVVADHKRIVEAIAARDAVGAQRALRGHLSGTLSQAEEIRRKHPEQVTE